MTTQNHRKPTREMTMPAETTALTDSTLAQAYWQHLSTLPGLLLWAAPVDSRKVPLPSWYAFTGQEQGAPEGREWLEAIHPEDRLPMETAWSIAQAAPAPFVNTFRLRRADGVYQPITLSATPVFDAAGAVIEWVGWGSQQPTPQRVNSSAGQQTPPLQALQALTDTALTHLELEELLQESLRRLCEVWPVDNAAILLVSDDGQILTLHAVQGPEANSAQEVRIPVGQGVAGRIAAEKTPLIIDDLSQAKASNPFLREQVRSLVGVPLLVQDRVLGVLHLATIRPHHFTEGDAHLLEQIAFRLALAIDHARLYQAEQQARAEATTRASQLEAVFEAAPTRIALYDAQGSIQRLNRASQEAVGPARGRETLAEFSDVYHLLTPASEPIPARDLPVARALRGEVIAGEELLAQYAPDDVRFLLVGAAPYSNAAGQIEGAVSVSQDVTALRRAEREAAERASHLQATFDAITDSLLVLDAEGRIVGGNATFRAQVDRGYPPGYTALTLPERARQTPLLGEQGQPLTLEAWPQSRVLAGEVLTGTDVLMPAPESGELHLNVSGAPIRDAQGRITGAVLLYRDLTAQRQLERRTQEALEGVLAMAEALVRGPDALDAPQEPPTREAQMVARQLADLTCQILGCKRVGISRLDPATDLMQPLTVAGLSPEQEAQWWLEQEHQQVPFHASPDPALVAQLEAGEVMQFDLTQPPYQELPNPYGITTMLIVPLRIEEQLLGLLSLDHGGVAHRYTPDEQRLAQAVARLTAFVIERERLLRERAEAEARALALQEANQRLETFIGIVSHELRTPVTSIKANLQLAVRRVGQAREAPDPAERLAQPLDLLERMEQQMRRLTRLLDDVIDLARIRTGKLEIAVEPCDLGSVLREVVRTEQASYPGRTIQLEAQSAQGVPVLADPDRLGQVISNYLTNALKYSPSHQPVVVGLTLKDDQAHVWVRDQGPGIPAEEQPRIWELFHRVSDIAVQSGSGVGLGLGLPISKTLVERQGGQVGVESTPGEGSTFWFTLPLAQSGHSET